MGGWMSKGGLACTSCCCSHLDLHSTGVDPSLSHTRYISHTYTHTHRALLLQAVGEELPLEEFGLEELVRALRCAECC